MRLRTPTQRWVARGSVAAAALLTMAGGMQAAANAAPARAAQPSAASGVDPYSPASSHPYRRGVVPTLATQAKMSRWAALRAGAVGQTTTNKVKTLAYGGGVDGIGVTTGDEKVYLVFYGNQWGTKGQNAQGDITFSNDPSGEAPYLESLFKGLGTGGETWSGVMTQYCQYVKKKATRCPAGAPHVAYPHGGALATFQGGPGIWYDNANPAPSGTGAPTATDLANVAIAAAQHFNNTTPGSNRDVQYVVLSPTGTDPDGWMEQGFCAWHDYTADPALPGGPVPSPYGDIAFTNMPYVTDAGQACGAYFVHSGAKGLRDGMSIVEGHEYAETITDQNPAGGWTVRNTRSKYYGWETGDVCAWIPPGKAGGAGTLKLPTGKFAMQSTWSNRARRGKGGCEFTAPITSTQLLRNPGFEARRKGWSATSGVVIRKSKTDPAHSGKYLARLDGRGKPHTDALSQTVTVPASYGAAQLSFWLQVRTNARWSRAKDTLAVQVLNSAGQVVRTLRFSNRSPRNRYHLHTIWLSSLLTPSTAPATFTITFTGVERLRHHNTAFLVDDTALNVS